MKTKGRVVWLALVLLAGCTSEVGPSDGAELGADGKWDDAETLTFLALPKGAVSTDAREPTKVRFPVETGQIYSLDLENPGFDLSAGLDAMYAVALRFTTETGTALKPHTIEAYADADVPLAAIPEACGAEPCLLSAYYGGSPLERAGAFRDLAELATTAELETEQGDRARRLLESVPPEMRTSSTYVLEMAAFMRSVRLFFLFKTSTEIDLHQGCVLDCPAPAADQPANP